MSGIVGFARVGLLERQARPILREMQRLIAHQEFYGADDSFCDAHVCTAPVHTNITKKRPQSCHESGLYVWLDGEFYNRDELGSQVESVTGDDSSLLLSLLKQNTDFSFLKRIDGTYLAVIYDSLCKRVHLITDRYGLRHLYWTIHNGALVWATGIRAMLALPGFEPNIDSLAVEEFFDIGYSLEDRTWFKGVELLSASTVLTWDIEEQSVRKQRYWWWDEIKPLAGKIDEVEIAQELARLFVNAVERRYREGERVGLMLSGGLDSRAILAAMPDRGEPIQAVTFGKAGCEDIRIAAMVAQVKGVVHHLVEIDKSNWLMPRLDEIWRTDGQYNLMHMHGIEALPQMEPLFDIVLDGAGGDGLVGGGHLFANKDFVPYLKKTLGAKLDNEALLQRFVDYFEWIGSSYILYVDHRIRSFLIYGAGEGIGVSAGLKYRFPFLDNAFQELLYAIPISIKVDNRLYKRMLLQAFPDFFERIPWQNTGAPIRWPDIAQKLSHFSRRVKYRVLREMGRFGLEHFDPRDYTDYPNWIRQEPARSFFTEVLTNSTALYPEYISREQVHRDWERHLDGEDHADYLCRYLTFEIWLQQLFEGKFRPVEGQG